MQREMPWLQDVNDREIVDMQLVTRCTSFAQAVTLSIALSGYTDETVADRLGVSKGQLSKIKNGRAGLTTNKLDRFSYATGNFAASQYMAWRDGFEMVRVTKHELIRELKEKLAKLEAA
jgi:transcriptional regulator with XRE-family HTH domain